MRIGIQKRKNQKMTKYIYFTLRMKDRLSPSSMRGKMNKKICKQLLEKGKWTKALCEFCLVRNKKKCRQEQGLA